MTKSSVLVGHLCVFHPQKPRPIVEIILLPFPERIFQPFIKAESILPQNGWKMIADMLTLSFR